MVEKNRGPYAVVCRRLPFSWSANVQALEAFSQRMQGRPFLAVNTATTSNLGATASIACAVAGSQDVRRELKKRVTYKHEGRQV